LCISGLSGYGETLRRVRQVDDHSQRFDFSSIFFNRLSVVRKIYIVSAIRNAFRGNCFAQCKYLNCISQIRKSFRPTFIV